MENLFLFAAKGLGIASIFFPNRFQQALPKKKQREAVPSGESRQPVEKLQVGLQRPQTALCGQPRRKAWLASNCGSPSGYPRPRCFAPLSWFAGKCCGTRVRGSVPQPQSSSLALPCQILVSVDGCQSLAAFGSCIHRMRAPSRRPITPAGTGGKRVPSGHNRRRRLATRRCVTKRAGTTAVVPATIEWQQCLLHLHFFQQSLCF